MRLKTWLQHSERQQNAQSVRFPSEYGGVPQHANIKQDGWAKSATVKNWHVYKTNAGKVLSRDTKN
jgi:hypothetical protein